MRVRVVCGLSETMASFVPTSRFSNVDLPALGRPMNEMNPTFKRSSPLSGVGTASPGMMRTLWMRRRSTSSTSTRSPSISTRSPTAGTRPRCVSRYPPTVSNPSRSMRTPSRWATSSMSTLPLKTKRPPPSSTIGSDSTSYSSRISPTISSSMSSIVTSPAVPPYSSTTMAICVCCR